MKENIGAVHIERKDVKLDAKDWKILFTLAQNARAGLSTLSKNSSLSTDGVRYRILRLKKQGVLLQRTAILNPFALGYQWHLCFIQLEHASDEKIQKILEFLAIHPYTIWASATLGSWDISIQIFARHQAHLEETLTEIKNICSPSLRDILIIPVLSVLNYHNLPPAMARQQGFIPQFTQKDGSFEPLFSKEPAIDKGEAVKVDEIDIHILSVLVQDAAQPLASIARSAGVTIDTVKHHIKSLIKKHIILSFNPIINVSFIGVRGHVIFIKRNHAQGDASAMEAYFKETISYPMRTLGTWDYVVFIAARDDAELYQMLRTLRNTFGKYITNFSTLNIIHDVKWSFLPEGMRKDLLFSAKELW